MSDNAEVGINGQNCINGPNFMDRLRKQKEDSNAKTRSKLKSTRKAIPTFKISLLQLHKQEAIMYSKQEPSVQIQ